VIIRSANQQDRERALRHGFFRRDGVGIEAACSGYRAHRENRSGAEERLADDRAHIQSRVVVADFTKTCERIFGGNGGDARLDGCGL
jgi:hypothetical protein